MDSICIQVLLGEEEKLPVTVCGIGRQEKQCSIYRKNGYPLYQFVFSRKGTGKLWVAGQEFEIQEGDYFYLKPNETHRYESSCEQWSTDWIQFKGQYVQETLEALEFMHSRAYTGKNMGKIPSQFQQILSTLQGNNPNKGYMASTEFYELLLLLFQYNRNYQSAQTKEDSHIMEPVLEYIENNYATPITLEELAALVAVTPQYLCRIFKDKLNMRPFEYIMKRRMQEAKKLLLGTSIPIKTIAKNVGYEDASYFGALFRKQEGVTASRYRGD